MARLTLRNLGSPTKATYERSVASVAHNVRRAVEIGAEGVVVHTGMGAIRELLAHPATDGVALILETPGSRDPGSDQIALVKKLRT